MKKAKNSKDDKMTDKRNNASNYGVILRYCNGYRCGNWKQQVEFKF